MVRERRVSQRWWRVQGNECPSMRLRVDNDTVCVMEEQESRVEVRVMREGW